MDKDTKEIVKAIRELTRELKAIRKVLEQQGKDPPVGEKDIDEYMI